MSSTDVASPSSNVQVVNVNQLSIQEITNFQEQVDNELEFFSESYQQLKEVQQKFQNSGESLSKLSSENKGKDILVPLTSSMYVPGTLSDVDSVLIDIGTGYYVTMAVDEAKDYFKRKTESLNQQLEKIQGILQEKQKIKRFMMEILQAKVQEALQNQNPQAAGAISPKGDS